MFVGREKIGYEKNKVINKVHGRRTSSAVDRDVRCGLRGRCYRRRSGERDWKRQEKRGFLFLLKSIVPLVSDRYASSRTSAHRNVDADEGLGVGIVND